MLSEHYFGDVEAIDEGNNHSEYFETTFIAPSSLSLSSLNNRDKYIIVGRKGAGKTAVQFHLSRQLEQKGYLHHFFSFYNDLAPSDLNNAVATQRIDLLKVDTPKNIFSNYDFRQVWERTFFLKLAETLAAAGFNSSFTRFALGERSRLSGLFEGLLKSASIRVSADYAGIAAEVGFDLSVFTSGEVPLAQYCTILRELFAKHHTGERAFLFVDELVFSKVDKKDDEIRVRAAMVRDIFRKVRELNNFFHKQNLDFHIIASIRPEIRDFICEFDAEINKIFDGKSVLLSWDMGKDTDSLLFRLFKQKVIHSKRGIIPLNYDAFVDHQISFGNRQFTLEEFIRTNTWCRPRDVVQLLNSIATKNPNSARIGVDEIKHSLNEFSRRSFFEIMEEVSVKHGSKVASTLRTSIKRQRYAGFSEFQRDVLNSFVSKPEINREALVEDLFSYGVIGNWSKQEGRYYWAHRGEEFFDKTLGVAIHEGLWNYFNIR